MADMNEEMLGALVSARKTHLEAAIIGELARRLGISLEDAMNRYYLSDLAEYIENNDFGLQYLDASYLVDEMLSERTEEAPSASQLES